MLTIVVGSDTAKRSAKISALSQSVRSLGVDVRFYSDISFDPNEIRSLAGSSSLFGEKIAAVISGVAESAEGKERLLEILPELSESEHSFFISEASLLAPFLKAAKKAGAEIVELEEKTKSKKIEAFNIFLLTDAFSSRKRTLAWALYRKALSSGLDPREIHSKLFWSVKTLLLAQNSPSSQEAGLHPFVFSKSKTAAKSFSSGELETIAYGLAREFHEHMGDDLEVSLESFLLRSLEKKSV